jgi:nucleotide-binding universal stress UspA family protein
VRPPEADPPKREVTLRRIVVPLDGSELAETALSPAAALAAATGAMLSLVRVQPLLSATAAIYGYTPGLDRMDADAAAACEDYLAQIKRRLSAGGRVETIVLRGSPASMLESFALTEDVDLVVMTTHGAGGLRRLVLGSTADRLVRAGAPTLLIRAKAGADGAAVAGTPLARHCATCGRLITFNVDEETRCTRCQVHLHNCANCVFFDTVACVLQRAEAHDRRWAGWHCPRFVFRETAPTHRDTETALAADARP